jgi:hypothetical protein
LGQARPLFDDPYLEIGRYFGGRIFPISTVVTIPQRTLARNPAVAEGVFEAFQRALGLYLEDVRQGNRKDNHRGLSLNRLEEEAGISFPNYGFKANRENIKMMIKYCFEQGIIASSSSLRSCF